VQTEVSKQVLRAAYPLSPYVGLKHAKGGVELTKRENASLNSETCSSVRESA